jgi:hypothetical protein
MNKTRPHVANLRWGDRCLLPQRRENETFEIKHKTSNGAEFKFDVTISNFAQDASGPARVAEVFVTGAKVGTDLETAARDQAVAVSIALQFGAPLETIPTRSRATPTARHAR